VDRHINGKIIAVLAYLGVLGVGTVWPVGQLWSLSPRMAVCGLENFLCR